MMLHFSQTFAEPDEAFPAAESELPRLQLPFYARRGFDTIAVDLLGN